MIIGLDLDEVCCDLVGNVCGHIHDVYDHKHNSEVFGSYNFHENDYTGNEELNAEVADDLITQVTNTVFLSMCPPINGTVEAVNTLKSKGHEVHILTARAEGEESNTIEWLNKHGYEVDSVTHIGFGSCKGVVGKAMGLDVFVDDHTYNIDSMLEHTDAKVYLINKPWNIDYYNKRVTRIGHVSDLLNELNLTGETNG